MLTRHWIFVDAKGRLETEVKGPGARGVTPVLPPGGEWTYESGTTLQTPHGSMHGSFQFEVLKGDLSAGKRSFSARVGRLLLASDPDQEPENVPCIPEADVDKLPATSVLSIERVIIGVTGRFVGEKKKTKNKPKMYEFAYDVQINNAREKVIEIIGHSWEVVDSNGRRHISHQGEGVGGNYGTRSNPLDAGDAFRVQGVIASPTRDANAEGTYRVLIKGDDGKTTEIEARTDFMGLSADKSRTHVNNFVAQTVFR
eukprot:gnl/TRDRNA2_/TRDRNA2_80501_c0_seq1.p1 gnl/TRDRNA2_/TRDRNA2_80501_c0~~gnl/TRDRNA2_/TRDRNA2_80501_c0_seq1.p1  ORF type:complete len:256 (-),score=49.20 gnl/TRDRNA2_/TRDRNA2_80501_c0_seq1:77-844(-)